MCDRPHIDDLGKLGDQLVGWALKGISTATAANGGRPRLDDGLTALMRDLAANAHNKRPVGLSTVSTPADGDRITVPEAARRLSMSQCRLREWILEGRIRGTRKVGRDWTLPADAVEELRVSRAADLQTRVQR